MREYCAASKKGKGGRPKKEKKNKDVRITDTINGQGKYTRRTVAL
jgi:hypothetical protein